MTRRGITLDLAAHQQQIAGWRNELAEARRTFLGETAQAPPEKPAEKQAFLRNTLPAEVIEACRLPTRVRRYRPMRPI